ncbi:MAG: YdjY domain-containing protein [Desulfuromonadaceae bacterium]
MNFIKKILHSASMVLIAATTLIAQNAPPGTAMPVSPTSLPVMSPSPPPMSADRHTFRVSPLEMVSPGVYRIAEVLVNKTQRSISFPAIVNMNKGLLEYLLVRNAGKTHESLFRTAVEPYNLQIACLLLDLVGTDKPLAFQGAPDTPKGDPVSISIEYVLGNGRSHIVNPKEWIVKTVDGERSEAPALNWIFTGSNVSNGRFASQMDGSIVALYHDPAAMIDNASAGGESDKIWFVNEQTTPPVGTKVTITIKPLKKP